MRFQRANFYHDRTQIEWATLILRNVSGNGNSLPYAFGTVNSCNRINIVNPSIYITAHSGIPDFFLVSEQFLFNGVFGVLLLETGFPHKLIWKSRVSSRNGGFWIELSLYLTVLDFCLTFHFYRAGTVRWMNSGAIARVSKCSIVPRGSSLTGPGKLPTMFIRQKSENRLSKVQ